MLKLGSRVIRGFNWAWDDGGGGYDGAGTICEIGADSAGKTIVVQWDCGDRTNYRGSYDLRILDNAQCGVRHLDIICDSCNQYSIIGFRYKCTDCINYDLCFVCYHNNKHILEHTFIRYDTPESRGVILSPRNMEDRICVKGIFKGAIVQVGNDWEWDTTDSGEGGDGYVREICNWGDESWRSAARVTWLNGFETIKCDYSAGHEGIMDLKYVKPGPGGQYYVKHLPIVSHWVAGERVKVLLDAETLESLQRVHGSWSPHMAEYIGKVGIVQDITDEGNVDVKYEGCAEPWTFHPGALERVAGNHGRASRPPPPAKKKIIRDEDSALRVVPSSGYESPRERSMTSEFANIGLGEEGWPEMELFSRADDNVNRSPARHTANLNQQKALGFEHTNVACNSCSQYGIIGVRYKCATCYDYDLCSLCYHNKKHNLEHTFTRYDTPESRGVKLSPRNVEEIRSGKIMFKGQDVVHPNAACDSCNQTGIIGIRYKCATCYDYDLCSLCYHNNKHNLEHTFTRYDTPESRGIKLSPRNVEEKKSAKGIIKGLVEGNTLPFDVPGKDPTLKERLDLARAISRSLSESSNQHNKGLSMFDKQKKKSAAWVHEVTGAGLWSGNGSTMHPTPGNSQPYNAAEALPPAPPARSHVPASAPPEPSVTGASAEQLRLLESRIQEMEETQVCSICMEGQRSIAFLCGHQTCADCATKLNICHICREPITKRIKLH